MSNVVITRPDPTVEREASARDILDVAQTPGFNALFARLDQMIESARRVCETSDSLREIRHAQGELRALKIVRQLPKILVSELDTEPKKRK